ncbi:hypothetical protein [Flavobacterium helocola]|jgi:hypothetical protein|uniref:Mce/MlaD domain-containing protein n=1 Tax=Flavobacterium helocola TaxID=3139139 RepID=A0ABU9I9L6_9FLAO
MKNNKKLAYIIIGICIVSVLYSVVKSYNNSIQLNNYGMQTIGRVIEIKGISKSKGYIYLYYIDGKTIKSESLIGLEENIRLGDFYKVNYLPNNPNIKKILSDKKITDTTLILKAGFSKEDIENTPK